MPSCRASGTGLDQVIDPVRPPQHHPTTGLDITSLAEYSTDRMASCDPLAGVGYVRNRVEQEPAAGLAQGHVSSSEDHRLASDPGRRSRYWYPAGELPFTTVRVQLEQGDPERALDQLH